MGFTHRKWRGLSEKYRRQQHEYALRYQTRLTRLHQQNTCPKCGQTKSPTAKTCMACHHPPQHTEERAAAQHLLTRPLQLGERIRIQDGHLQVLSGGRILDATPLGRAEIALDLHMSYGLHPEQIADRLLLSSTTIYKYIRLASFLPTTAKKRVRDGSLSLQDAYILSQLQNKNKISYILKHHPELTGKDLESYVQKILAQYSIVELSPDPRDTLAANIEALL